MKLLITIEKRRIKGKFFTLKLGVRKLSGAFRSYFRRENPSTYWYMRDGDFLPDSVNEYYGGTGMSYEMIKELKTLGNLFETKEEAAQASEKVREFIRSSFGKQS